MLPLRRSRTERSRPPVRAPRAAIAPQLRLPRAVEQPRDAREVVARREPAPQAHHRLAGLGLARALLGALAAVVAEPRIERGLRSLLLEAHLQEAHGRAREHVRVAPERADRGAVAAVVALLHVLGAVPLQLVDQLGVDTDGHRRTSLLADAGAGSWPALSIPSSVRLLRLPVPAR